MIRFFTQNFVRKARRAKVAKILDIFWVFQVRCWKPAKKKSKTFQNFPNNFVPLLCHITSHKKTCFPWKRPWCCRKTDPQIYFLAAAKNWKFLLSLEISFLLSKMALLDLLAWYLDYFFHKKIINEFSTWKINKVWQEFLFFWWNSWIFTPYFQRIFKYCLQEHVEKSNFCTFLVSRKLFKSLKTP